MDISSFIHYAFYTKILTKPSIIKMIRPMYIMPLMLSMKHKKFIDVTRKIAVKCIKMK